ncbi:AraC-type DNA-binding protein [Paenibacillus sp. UNCCL117]|uniref:helix-turn-helix transcriptional regulator n=1 Tax=unclassified Paenibacillus TaxID=185978 RepID=UPI0008907EBB|nr:MULTISPECIES: AraC family transcriptional regulator [unclassified Paenibacillus]SDD06502.1 AraC-type DNA-binding protein [Paenibacillus sp. cl123]SFW31677.1 AraC-type DNA-binding protein [Paenibacillus sp. UNCCL117]
MEPNLYLTADRFPLLRDMGHNRTEDWYTHPDRIVDYEVFLFVSEGCMQVIEEGTEYFVGEREHLFLRSGLHHWGKRVTAPGTSWWWIHFHVRCDDNVGYQAPSLVPELEYVTPQHYQVQIPLPKFGKASLHAETETRLSAMYESYIQPKPNPYRMTEASLEAYRLFIGLQQHSPSPSREGTHAGKAEAHVARIMDYLARHASEEFDAGSLAVYMGLNYSHLSSLFARRTGQTIIEVHTRLRMNRAIQLMRTTSLNIAEISERLGYHNPFYFTRVFKKVLGEPPSAYMKHIYR